MSERTLKKLKLVNGILKDSDGGLVEVVEYFKPKVLTEFDYKNSVDIKGPGRANAYLEGDTINQKTKDIVGRVSLFKYVLVQYYRVK